MHAGAGSSDGFFGFQHVTDGPHVVNDRSNSLLDVWGSIVVSRCFKTRLGSSAWKRCAANGSGLVCDRSNGIHEDI